MVSLGENMRKELSRKGKLSRQVKLGLLDFDRDWFLELESWLSSDDNKVLQSEIAF